MIEKVKGRLEESAQVKRKMIEEGSADDIVRIADCLIESLHSEGKLLLCGNGGSAADSQHMAAELVGRFKIERKGLPAISLTTDTSILTALSNDYDYDSVFSRQIEALGKAGDTLVAFSTSGNSKNVLEAVELAKKMGIRTVGFTGGDGGKLAKAVDICLVVPAVGSDLIQEGHITAYHIICGFIEEEFTS